MDADQNLAKQMAEKPNDELLEMLRLPEHWRPEALDAARAELQRRGVDTSAVKIWPPTTPWQACPRCHGTSIIAGDMTGDGSDPGLVVFRPEATRFFRFTWASGVSLRGQVYACRDCGLTWGLVDRVELAEFIMSH
jgi:hypothetical protein